MTYVELVQNWLNFNKYNQQEIDYQKQIEEYYETHLEFIQPILLTKIVERLF